MRSAFLLFTSVALLAGLAGCGRNREAEARGPTIALVVKTLNNPFFIDMQRGAEESANRLGVNLIVQAADREVDVERQMQIIENLIQRKVDALCVTPSGTTEIVPAILKANQSGIPVLIVDTRADVEALEKAGGKTVTFIGSDNYEGGKIAGAYMVELLGGAGKVAILEGIPGHETGDSRLKGFHESISVAPGIEVVASQTANWERDQGFNVFQNILEAHPDIDGLFAASDLMALGALEAISAAGKTGQIIVVSFDALDEAREAVENGLMAGTVAQYPSEMGRIAIESAFKVLQGETIPEYLPVNIELVKKEN